MGRGAQSAVLAVSILSSAFFSTSARAQFMLPAGGKLTEKQVVNYIAVLKVQMEVFQAVGDPNDGTSLRGLGIYSRENEKMNASLAQHGMSKEEYDWVGDQVGELWPTALQRQQLEDKIKVEQGDLAAANATLATYQQSQKEGKRVLNSVQHDAATQAAGGELDSAKQTVADATANVKQITDEVAGHDKDVADDEALAKNPPANLAGDDRSNYIDARKNDAQTARDAATDARSRLKDAQKSLDDAKAALATVQGKLEHPDVPGTDEERAAIKQQNEQAIAGAKATINLDQKAIKSLKDALAAVPMTVDESQTRGGPTTIVKLDPDNLAIVQKHLAEYLTVVGASEVPKTK